MSGRTLVLWGMPVALLVIGCSIVFVVYRQLRSKGKKVDQAAAVALAPEEVSRLQALTDTISSGATQTANATDAASSSNSQQVTASGSAGDT